MNQKWIIEFKIVFISDKIQSASGEIEDYEVWYKMIETDLLMFSSKAGSFCTHFTSRILLICYQTSYFAPYTYVPIQKFDPRG